MSGGHGDVVLESFSDPSHAWRAMNDPVMGGKSHATVTIADGLGIFDGEVVDVPFLRAPGFVTMIARDGVPYPDVSSCRSLAVRARSSVPYSGYRISFGDAHVPGNRYAFGYKADFDPPVGSEMGDVSVPFRDFSVRWDDRTGDQIVTCEEDERYCPDLKTLRNMRTISIWGEGVAGRVHLEVESIRATGCSSAARVAKEVGQEGTALPPVMLAALVAAVVGAALLFIKRSRTRQEYQDVDTVDGTVA